MLYFHHGVEDEMEPTAKIQKLSGMAKFFIQYSVAGLVIAV
jgi:hypothetical protein